ncbi:hypothetical protein J4464_06335 [Candidatus Woesearchaeota archaeon]|nr:hypothetical protein [Candidatus Woesearchaeota archaeon]
MIDIFITFMIVLLFLVLFGSILYIVSHWLVGKWQEYNIKKRTVALWMWRAALSVAILYIVVVLFLNRNVIIFAEQGSQFIILVGALIFFVSLIEIVIIDLLLPDVIAMWKRMAIEMLVFFMLICVTAFVFYFYSTVG